MRILFISQLFDPEYSIKGLGLMKHWQRQGHNVEVVTTFPNYPEGKVFDGYKVGFKRVEYVDGVKIVRLWSYISHSKSKVSRALSYLSYTFMALFYALFTKKPDVVYAYHPQVTTGLVGIVMKACRNVPFITDVQDLWPDSLIATGISPDNHLIGLIDRWCKYVYQRADRIVVLSHGFKSVLVGRGVDSNKVSVVYNWCPEEKTIESTLSVSDKQDDGSPMKLVYAGNLGAAQALKYVIDAVLKLSPDEIEFDIYGGGVEFEELKKRAIGANNINFFGYVRPAELFPKLSEADLLVVHLRNDDLFKITIPSKTQSSLAMGKPLLMAVGGEANEMVKVAGAGFIADPCSVNSLCSALREALDERQNWNSMGRRARDFYFRELSAKKNYTRLDMILKEL